MDYRVDILLIKTYHPVSGDEYFIETDNFCNITVGRGSLFCGVPIGRYSFKKK